MNARRKGSIFMKPNCRLCSFIMAQSLPDQVSLASVGRFAWSSFVRLSGHYMFIKDICFGFGSAHVQTHAMILSDCFFIDLVYLLYILSIIEFQTLK